MTLSDESTEALWRRYVLTRDLNTRNELITRYASIVRAHGARLGRRLPARVQMDEITSAAFDGLIAAVEMFDPARGIKFETYATTRIVGAVGDWLRSIDPQARGVRDFQQRRDVAFTLVSSDIGDRASAPQIAKRIGMDPGKYRKLVKRVREGTVASLSAADSDSSCTRRAKRDDIPDHRQPSPQRGVEREMLRDYITRGLSWQERHVLLLYYYDELTMGESGKVLGLSESRVSQIHKRILTALRQRFGLQRELRAVV